MCDDCTFVVNLDCSVSDKRGVRACTSWRRHKMIYVHACASWGVGKVQNVELVKFREVC